jgi:serine/threonine protein kinase
MILQNGVSLTYFFLKQYTQKPENLMLSTENTSDAVIKLIDFGCAQVTASDKEEPGVVGLTAAYSSPEMLRLPPKQRKRIDPPLDMWALGIILHIMLVGCHPFDVVGDAPDTEIAKLVKAHKTPPTLKEKSELNSHLSDSAMDLIRRLLEWDPKKRITAAEMLQHPWVRGDTAKTDKISGSDKKLSKFRVFKSSLEAKVFADFVSADTEDEPMDVVSKRTSLIERSFRKLDEEQKGKKPCCSRGCMDALMAHTISCGNKGFITAKDLKRLTGSSGLGADGDSAGKENEALSLSEFSSLLSDNMKDRYFPRDHILFKEGEIGNSMVFVNSGKLEVTTKDGYVVEVHAGSFVGEG